MSDQLPIVTDGLPGVDAAAADGPSFNVGDYPAPEIGWFERVATAALFCLGNAIFYTLETCEKGYKRTRDYMGRLAISYGLPAENTAALGRDLTWASPPSTAHTRLARLHLIF